MSTITTNDGTQIYYKDWRGDHGLAQTHKDRLNADLLFARDAS